MLHRFDADGVHTDSDIWFAGTSADEQGSIDRAEARLLEWLDALPGRAYGDIAIGLFQVEADGHVFGLVDWSHEYDGGTTPSSSPTTWLRPALGRLLRHLSPASPLGSRPGTHPLVRAL
ncbi:hypothetical protein ACFY1S_22835 [Micromonospora sp. NPDC000663]|uniref:hypothetical protein n=1 Tax=Micromonospora sp. NPDC000663 TaxID=3364218 RepID=UPI0036C430D8